ncbi:DUF4442 domain-containing protein [Rhodococcoides kroppenstedtii]|uniref:DUF4442 domain-containing protein n=1 Tax=Rhodococcoides kroppenstedtii TaxID=293050 RepID=UPI001427A2B1|nr:DUF4442 domain-containing protein [Rhodococcus kroppenstedtii]NIL82455.1 hypothetical protein [Rhodococcus kroppenstedtii]
MTVSPRLLRTGMNLWPPFLGAGIRVTDIAADWSSVTVTLRLNRLTRNYVGTAFGGSMSAMTDPFYMLLLTHRLGREYLVWDTAGEIRFLSPGRSTLTAYISIDDATVDTILDGTRDGAKSLTWFETAIVDADGTTAATVRREVYVRKKRRD